MGYLRGFPGSSVRDKHLIYVPINSLAGHIFHFMEELNIGWKAKQICKTMTIYQITSFTEFFMNLRGRPQNHFRFVGFEITRFITKIKS